MPPPPLAVRRHRLAQMVGVPLRAVPAFPWHHEQQDTPPGGAQGDELGGAWRGRSKQCREWQQELGTVPVLVFPRHTTSQHLGDNSWPWLGTQLQEQGVWQEPATSLQIQTGMRPKEPSGTGMKKPLSGSIALWRTTFSAAAVRFRVIFFPSI